jgi:DNA gyrase subunit B
LSRALDNASLLFEPDAPPLQAEPLEGLLREFMAAEAAIRRLGNRYDPVFLTHQDD